jgi:hypothetical protein
VTRRLLPVLGRLLLTALLLFLILVVGFYTLYGALFALDGGQGWGTLIWMGFGGGIVFLLGWWIARLWLRKKAVWR